MANARQFTKAGRWVLLKADEGMFWTMEGPAPRQGHVDSGDKKSNQHVGAPKAIARLEREATQRLRDGWQETAVGWAEAAAPAAPAAAPAKTKETAKPSAKNEKPAAARITSPTKLAAPRKSPAARAIADTRRDVLDAVGARAKKARLTAWERIEALVRSAMRIELVAPGGPSLLGSSRVGGAPDLPAGTKWPRASRPLEFVAQVRLEELAAYDVEKLLPRAGLLLFFADLSPASDDYLSEGVVIHVEKLAGLTRCAPPEGVTLLPEHGIEWSATLSLPPPEGAFIAKARLGDDDVATYNDRVFLPSLRSGTHQLLGYPLLTEVEDARADAHCLLQLASTKKHKLAFGDAQTLRFTLRAGALAKGSFARVDVTADEV